MRKRNSQLPPLARNIFYLFLLAVPLLLSSCKPAPTYQSSSDQRLIGTPQQLQPTPTPTPIPRSTSMYPLGQKGTWNLLFHDEFDASTLDTTKWNTCFFNFAVGNGCDHGTDEQELYQPNNVSISHSMLNLQANHQTVTAVNKRTYHYTSGMISTGPASYLSSPKFVFKYGYAEMRAKIPAGVGLLSTFWLLPASLNWPPEIDTFEIIGNDPTTLAMHYTYPISTSKTAQVGNSLQGADFSADWHTFAIDWEPGSITWYVDGVKSYNYATIAVPSQPMYLLANLAVGGALPGSPTASTPFPGLFQIDYIRVWQK